MALKDLKKIDGAAVMTIDFFLWLCDGAGYILHDKHNTSIEHDRRLQAVKEFMPGSSNGIAIVERKAGLDSIGW